MANEFVHLHTHSDYSMLDGACKIQELAELASENKMSALALTDHGNLCGAIDFYTKMNAKGVKPIIGCECYLAPESRFDRTQKNPHHKGYHQILYAQDYDDPFTEDINEGAIGSGHDDPFTEGINEGSIGSGYDDPFTEDINEGAIGSGYDDPFTEDINEGAIGSGYDDPFTEGVNEGAWH